VQGLCKINLGPESRLDVERRSMSRRTAATAAANDMPALEPAAESDVPVAGRDALT